MRSPWYSITGNTGISCIVTPKDWATLRFSSRRKWSLNDLLSHGLVIFKQTIIFMRRVGGNENPLRLQRRGGATCKGPMAPDLSLWKRTLHSAVLCVPVCWNGNVVHVLLWTPASNAQPEELTNAYGQSYDANNVGKTYPKRQATSADSRTHQHYPPCDGKALNMSLAIPFVWYFMRWDGIWWQNCWHRFGCCCLGYKLQPGCGFVIFIIKSLIWRVLFLYIWKYVGCYLFLVFCVIIEQVS